MLRTILVPLDGSPLAERAVAVAGEVGRRNAAVVHLVLAHEGIGWILAMGQPVPMPRRMDADLELEHSAYLQSIAARLARETGVATHWSVMHGPAANAIDRYIRDHDIDLVVMTTHGRGGLARAWLGSTTDGLLRLTNVPLLLLRGSVQAPVTGFDRVLAALDGSTTAERALATAAQLRSDGVCTLLYVVAPRMVYPSHYIPDVEEQQANARTYLGCVGDRVRQGWKEIETRVVTSEEVAETVLSQAREVRANLLVLGTHARTPLMRAMVGSVADKVIRGAEIAVLVAPPSDVYDAAADTAA
jgi:nucleotide-binding universal stress UspA family protein